MAEPENMREMLFAELESAEPPARPAPEARPMAAAELLQRIAGQANQDEEDPTPPGQLALGDLAEPEPDPIMIEDVITTALQDMLSDPEASFQPEGFLYQDFSVRCRMQKLRRVPLDLAAFRRRYAIAKAGIFDPTNTRWTEALSAASRLPDDMLAPFLLIARAAMEGEPCPDDDALGRAYGTRSPGRIRRLIEYMEKQGVIVLRNDFSGRRSVGIPELGLSTEAD
jgi:hypothetical protein